MLSMSINFMKPRMSVKMTERMCADLQLKSETTEFNMRNNCRTLSTSDRSRGDFPI